MVEVNSQTICPTLCAIERSTASLMALKPRRTRSRSARLCSEPIPEGTPVALFNDKTGKRVEASVVWAGVVTLSLASPTLFQFKIGVEFDGLGTAFWGSDYNP